MTWLSPCPCCSLALTAACHIIGAHVGEELNDLKSCESTEHMVTFTWTPGLLPYIYTLPTMHAHPHAKVCTAFLVRTLHWLVFAVSSLTLTPWPNPSLTITSKSEITVCLIRTSLCFCQKWSPIGNNTFTHIHHMLCTHSTSPSPCAHVSCLCVCRVIACMCVCERSDMLSFSLATGTVVVWRLVLFGFLLVTFYFCCASNAAWLLAQSAVYCKVTGCQRVGFVLRCFFCLFRCLCLQSMKTAAQDV